MEIRIGLLECTRVEIRFIGIFHNRNSEANFRGDYIYEINNYLKKEEYFMPINPETSFFEVKNIVIGKGFHWQQEESQRFKGSLLLRNDGKVITVINILSIEEYLESVISSEMRANASPEFLKAHAIISRSWVMNRILHRNESYTPKTAWIETSEKRIKWYDDSQHIGFDVCADDHCQRYQGITRITNSNAIDAVKETNGLVLTYNGEIADARFSKCCGGAFETFENCWANTPLPYLTMGRDYISQKITRHKKLNLEKEENATKWIENEPKAFCNTHNQAVLKQVLNNYDLETTDFYRWKVEYTTSELSNIIKEKSGIDFGIIKNLIPLQRGESGRITKLKIVGSKKTMLIGKELEIRRTLSKSHLYSSAFTITKEFFSDASITKQEDKFILNGAGWGHGVGLCQIGAAMMAYMGYSYTEILNHYYPGCTIRSIYHLQEKLQ